jgi:hypothetical protein
LLRPFDRSSSELLGEGSRRKGRAVGEKVGKKVVVKVPEVLLKGSRFGIEAEVEEQDENTAQPSNDNLIESIEADDCDIKQIRKTKTQIKMTITKQVRKKVDEVTRGAKTPEDIRSTLVESIESEDEGVSQIRRTVKSKQFRKAMEDTRAKPPPEVESDEEDFGLDSDGMSDFIVDDSTFLKEEDTAIEEPAPRSVRRLVKGRKPRRVEAWEDEDEDLDLKMGKLKIEEDASMTLDRALKELDLDISDDEDLLEAKTKKTSKNIQSKVPRQPKGEKVPPASSDIDDPYTLR